MPMEDVGSKLLAWVMTGTGALLAYSAFRNKSPLSVLRGIEGPSISGSGSASGTGSGIFGSIPLPTEVAGVSSIARLRMIANREIAPTLVAIQPYGQLDKDAAASLARIDTKHGYVVPASSANDAYRPFAVQAAAAARGEMINGKPRYADPNKGLHVVGLAFDIHSGFNKPEVWNAFRAEGWHQSRPIDEPWHWSYGVRG